jgi:hypothetical protein
LPRHDYQPWRCNARRSSHSVITRVQVQTVWSLIGARRDLVFFISADRWLGDYDVVAAASRRGGRVI